jgi:hypothetical protein
VPRMSRVQVEALPKLPVALITDGAGCRPRAV